VTDAILKLMGETAGQDKQIRDGTLEQWSLGMSAVSAARNSDAKYW
jgi:hypothetical protein